VLSLLCAPAAVAQNAASGIKPIAPAPIPPETVSRTTDGGVTVRAVRIAEPIQIDGRLDEEIYSQVPAISDFIQQEPEEGMLATEKTEVWIFFDDRNIYVSARCWDSHPEREIANEMRRDANNITGQNDNFAMIFDSFHDKRNGLMFQTTPIGAMRDTMSTDEVNQNADWNTVWDVRTQRSSTGWTAEFSIPFKSLRYGPGREQTWGLNLRRIVRWKNELSYLSVPPAYLGQRAIIAVSQAGTLVGLEAPASRKMLEVKPFAISGLRTDLGAKVPLSNDVNKQLGIDAKYGVTKGLTLDLTYNTDFAQVEDDTQQVNLTRFNQFFPEKREFFLEGQGIFAFGGGGAGGPGDGGGGASTNTPVNFFSRRIGLENGRPVPIAAGARLTGRVGSYSVGLLNIQSKEDIHASASATNFSVVRLKRNVFRRSNVGLLYTRRQATSGGGNTGGETFGVDALYSVRPSLNINGYYAKTRTPGLTKDDTSHLVRFDYNVDRYGMQLEHLTVGTNYAPAVGFLRRLDFKRGFVQGRFSPRPAKGNMTWVRRFVYMGNVEYIENNEGRLDFREQEGNFTIEMQNSDQVNVTYTRDYEYIPKDFAIASTVSVPVGGYNYQNLSMSYNMGPQHLLSGRMSYQQGSLYGGTKRTLGLGGGRIDFSSQLSIEPSLSLNWVDLPWGTFTSQVITNRTTFTLNPRMFVSALVQYSSSSRTLSTNARFRWEYQPASELFVVYSDGRDTIPTGFPTLMNRAFIVKITKLFRL
jgi:hypothetical protein